MYHRGIIKIFKRLLVSIIIFIKPIFIESVRELSNECLEKFKDYLSTNSTDIKKFLCSYIEPYVEVPLLIKPFKKIIIMQVLNTMENYIYDRLKLTRGAN